MWINRTKYFINVYSGISPSLLATISMSAEINAKSQIQLVQMLKKQSIVRSSRLESILKQIDRSWFTADKSPYRNKPLKISGGEYMTDPFTQFLILQHIETSLQIFKDSKRQINCLDLGTGHGYMAFAIARLMDSANIKYTMYGIDIYEEAINKANLIKRVNFKDTADVRFTKQNLESVEMKHPVAKGFDVINCGFFVKEQLHQKLIGLLNTQSVGVWPISENHEQKLYKFIKRQNKLQTQYLISTLFSEQKSVLNPDLHKYFVEYGDHEQIQHQQPLSEQPKQKKAKYYKAETKEQFRQWQEQFKSKHNRAPTLKQIQSDETANNLLKNLKHK